MTAAGINEAQNFDNFATKIVVVIVGFSFFFWALNFPIMANNIKC